MVLPSQHLFMIIRWLKGLFKRRDGCDGFPMADLIMKGVATHFFTFMGNVSG